MCMPCVYRPRWALGVWVSVCDYQAQCAQPEPNAWYTQAHLKKQASVFYLCRISIKLKFACINPNFGPDQKNSYLWPFICILLYVICMYICMYVSTLYCLAACTGFVFMGTINSIYFYNLCLFIAEFSMKMVVIMLLSSGLFAMYLLWKHLTFKRLNSLKHSIIVF